MKGTQNVNMNEGENVKVLARLPRAPLPGEQGLEIRVCTGMRNGYRYVEARFFSLRNDEWHSSHKFLRLRSDELEPFALALQAAIAEDAQ